VDGAEIGLDLARLRLAGRRELVENDLLEGVAGAQVTEDPGHQNGDRAKQHERRKQLRRETPAHGPRGSSHIEDRQ